MGLSAPDLAVGSGDHSTEPREAPAGVRQVAGAGAQHYGPVGLLLEGVQQGQAQEIKGIHGVWIGVPWSIPRCHGVEPE